MHSVLRQPSLTVLTVLILISAWQSEKNERFVFDCIKVCDRLTDMVIPSSKLALRKLTLSSHYFLLTIFATRRKVSFKLTSNILSQGIFDIDCNNFPIRFGLVN